MATLDVSSVLLSPEFSTNLLLKRREQILDGYGRVETTTVTEQTISGVLLASRANDNKVDLRRSEDFELTMRNVTVYTQFKMRGSSRVLQPDGSFKTYLPDIISWLGNDFVLVSFDMYKQFGAGFYRATMQSMDQDDYAPT